MSNIVICYHNKLGGIAMTDEQRAKLLAYPSVKGIQESYLFSLQVADIRPYLEYPDLVLILWQMAVRYEDVEQVIAQHQIRVFNHLRTWQEVLAAIESVRKEESK